MKKVKVTVYITSHNYGKYLQDAIESVLRQTIDCWELLLFNDDSADNTQSIIDLYKGDERIRIFNTDGIGLSSVANLALKYSGGEYIIRLDADDVFDENILLVLSNCLDRDSDVALVFPDYFLVDKLGRIIVQERRQSIYQINHSLDMPANGACTLIRKDVLEDLDGYREDLKAQDGFDLWSRVIRKYKCSNVNIPLFYYRRHGENLTDNLQHILTARRRIKQDAGVNDLKKFGPISAVIPCRKNYDVYPDLWSKEVNGKTLLDIAIQTCMSSSLLDNIIVASDNPAVKDTISKYNDTRLKYFERKSESTILSRSIAFTLEDIIKYFNLGWDGLILLDYISAPFNTTEILEEAIYTLVLNDATSSFAVEEIDLPLYRRSPYGLTHINAYSNLKSDFDVVYVEARTVLATRSINIKSGSLTGSKIVNFVLPKNEVFFIQTKRDYEIAKMLVRRGGLV